MSVSIVVVQISCLHALFTIILLLFDEKKKQQCNCVVKALFISINNEWANMRKTSVIQPRTNSKRLKLFPAYNIIRRIRGRKKNGQKKNGNEKEKSLSSTVFKTQARVYVDTRLICAALSRKIEFFVVWRCVSTNLIQWRAKWVLHFKKLSFFWLIFEQTKYE